MLKGTTGRIGKRLTATARRILFARDLSHSISQELPIICSIDCAHVLMLAEGQIISAGLARKLLKAIRQLTEEQFLPLQSRLAERGLFLLYEEYLIETQGPEVGGMLQIGRSRNDLGATLVRLRSRGPYQDLIGSALRLQAVLLRRAQTYATTVMPAYTHGQAAEPITYGHYLAAVAEALSRDIDGMLDSAQEMDTCPLGAAAVAGTSVPINRQRTSSLLGFTRCSPNSVDAVASRDFVLRLLAATAIYATTLSRMATDLLQWLTAEFHFLLLPDELVGSSSAMPQKRNPFLLEHVQGRTASALGGFSSALAATRNAPFTNSIAVGTESVRPLWNTLSDATDAGTLLRLVLSKARPDSAQMLKRATESFTNATVIATRMTLEHGTDFRSAHRYVGQAVTEALSKGLSSLEELAKQSPGTFTLPAAGVDPKSCVDRNRYGGGPALENVRTVLAQLSKRWSLQRRHVLDQTRRWTEADYELQRAVKSFIDS